MHELKASKFLSFHILVASLVFNRSQQGQKRQRWQEGEGRRGRLSCEGGRREKDGKKHRWRNGLEMTLKSPRFKSVLLFKMQTLQIETRIKQYPCGFLQRYLYS